MAYVQLEFNETLCKVLVPRVGVSACLSVVGPTWRVAFASPLSVAVAAVNLL